MVLRHTFSLGFAPTETELPNSFVLAPTLTHTELRQTLLSERHAHRISFPTNFFTEAHTHRNGVFQILPFGRHTYKTTCSLGTACGSGAPTHLLWRATRAETVLQQSCRNDAVKHRVLSWSVPNGHGFVTNLFS